MSEPLNDLELINFIEKLEKLVRNKNSNESSIIFHQFLKELKNKFSLEIKELNDQILAVKLQNVPSNVLELEQSTILYDLEKEIKQLDDEYSQLKNNLSRDLCFISELNDLTNELNSVYKKFFSESEELKKFKNELSVILKTIEDAKKELSNYKLTVLKYFRRLNNILNLILDRKELDQDNLYENKLIDLMYEKLQLI